MSMHVGVLVGAIRPLQMLHTDTQTCAWWQAVVICYMYRGISEHIDALHGKTGTQVTMAMGVLGSTRKGHTRQLRKRAPKAI